MDVHPRSSTRYLKQWLPTSLAGSFWSCLDWIGQYGRPFGAAVHPVPCILVTQQEQ